MASRIPRRSPAYVVGGLIFPYCTSVLHSPHCSRVVLQQAAMQVCVAWQLVHSLLYRRVLKATVLVNTCPWLVGLSRFLPVQEWHGIIAPELIELARQWVHLPTAVSKGATLPQDVCRDVEKTTYIRGRSWVAHRIAMHTSCFLFVFFCLLQSLCASEKSKNLLKPFRCMNSFDDKPDVTRLSVSLCHDEPAISPR